MDCPFKKERDGEYPGVDCIAFNKISSGYRWLFTTLGVLIGVGLPALKGNIYVQLMEAEDSLKSGPLLGSLLVIAVVAIATMIVVGTSKHRNMIGYLFHAWGYPTVLMAAFGLATLRW